VPVEEVACVTTDGADTTQSGAQQASSTVRGKGNMLLWSLRETAAATPSPHQDDYNMALSTDGATADETQVDSVGRSALLASAAWRSRARGAGWFGPRGCTEGPDVDDDWDGSDLSTNAFTVDTIEDRTRDDKRMRSGGVGDASYAAYNPFADEGFTPPRASLRSDSDRPRMPLAPGVCDLSAKLDGIIETEHWSAESDAFLQLIDVRHLRGLLKLPGYRDRCGEVIRAAVDLVKNTGAEHVVMLQLAPQSVVDHAGVLRGYTMVVHKTASVAPILDTMPDYGAGRAVLNSLDPKVHERHTGKVPNEFARKAVSDMIRSQRVVDFSNPTTSAMRSEAHAFLYGLKQGGYDSLNIVPKSLGQDLASSAIDTDLYRGIKNEAERLRVLQLSSLGKHGCSVAVCENMNDPTLVCDNYSQITADLIDHACRTCEFTTVQQFLESPLSTLGLEHSAVARAAVLARVSEALADNNTCTTHSRARVSFCSTHAPEDDHDWYAEPSIPSRDLTDHAHCTVRGLSNDSLEWTRVVQYAVEELAMLQQEDVHDARRREMLDLPGSNFAIVFNNVTDPVYRSKALQPQLTPQQKQNGGARRPEPTTHSFSIDLGSAVGYRVFQSAAPFVFRDVLLGMPHAGVMPHNARKLEALMKPEKKRYAADAIGYHGSFDPLEVLPLRATPRGDLEPVQRLFSYEDQRAPAVEDFLALHKLLGTQFAQSMPRNNDYSTYEQTHLVVFKWCAAIDESLLSLEKRVRLAGHLDTIVIDARHKRQVAEVMQLIAESLVRVAPDDPLLPQLQAVFCPGTNAVNPSGVVLSIPTELAEALLRGWSHTAA
jgi:hypothetical protein